VVWAKFFTPKKQIMEKDWTAEMQEKLVKAIADRLAEWLYYAPNLESGKSCLEMAKTILDDCQYFEIDGFLLAKNFEDEFGYFANQELVLLLSDVNIVAARILQNTYKL